VTTSSSWRHPPRQARAHADALFPSSRERLSPVPRAPLVSSRMDMRRTRRRRERPRGRSTAQPRSTSQRTRRATGSRTARASGEQGLA
jgi:hypothetical protein